jgi:hypothetical protein
VVSVNATGSQYVVVSRATQTQPPSAAEERANNHGRTTEVKDSLQCKRF